MHIEIYLEDYNDLVRFAKEARSQIFSEDIDEKNARLWFCPPGAPAIVTVFMATIPQKALVSLEVGGLPNQRIVPASIEVIHE